ncbi:hypothetical protein ACQ4LE_011221 [Meloidogyne hapla]
MKIANIINILRKLSGWIVEDKENNKYNSDMKFITVDLISNNFVCEACEYAIKHRLRKTKQKQLQLSPANKNIRTTIKKHLNKSEFHAKSVRLLSTEQINQIETDIQTEHEKYKKHIDDYNKKFHYITRNNATILLNNAKILNFDGYSYNKDRETYLKGTFTIYFDCSKANCSGRAQVVNNLFILSNNGHNCNSNKFLDAIINQYPNFLQSQMEEEDHNIALTIQRKEILDMQTSQDQKTGEPSTRIGDEEEIDYNDYFENKEIEPFEWQRDLDHQIAEGSLSSRTQQTMEQQDFHQNHNATQDYASLLYPNNKLYGGSSSSHNHPGASIYTNQLWDSQYQPPFTHQNTSGIGESSSYQLLDPTYAPQPVVQPSQLQQHAPGIDNTQLPYVNVWDFNDPNYGYHGHSLFRCCTRDWAPYTIFYSIQ